MAKLEKGVKCPEFKLLNQNGETITEKSFQGKKVLIYFYPKAMTPGCTIQSCNVRNVLSEFSENNIVAIGISADSPTRQKKFDDKYSLGFTLLSDDNHTVAEAFDVWVEKSILGIKYMGTIRSSFLVDEDGIIIEAWYKVSPKNTVANVMKILK